MSINLRTYLVHYRNALGRMSQVLVRATSPQTAKNIVPMYARDSARVEEVTL